MSKKIKLEILEGSYWEHFKYLKDISLIYDLHHPKRIQLEKVVNDLLKEINDIKNAK